MGKSARKKAKYKYSKDEFVDIVCSKCGLCVKGTKPVFCFYEVYRCNPKLFINNILEKLIQESATITYCNTTNDYDKITALFTEIFCNSNFCKKGKHKKNGCKYINCCVNAFKEQLQQGDDVTPLAYENVFIKKKENKKKSRYIIKPYPTFLCNEGFKKEVEDIVNGSNN